MSGFGNDYQVARSTGRCAATGDPLEPGTACIATLVEREDDDGFDRLDFSVPAWDEGARPEHLFSYWRTHVPEPNRERRLLVDDEVLIEVFHRLDADDRPQRKSFRFVLALILMRKKQLRFVGREVMGPDGAEEDWLLLPRGSEPDNTPIRVRNPRLTDDDVRELTEQLREVLQGDL